MGLYYINCSQYGNYRQIYWHKNSIKKNLLEDAYKLYASGCRESESVSANQKPGRSSLYIRNNMKSTHMTSSMSSIFFLQMFFEIQAAVE